MRKLLQGTAQLEFWETYNFSDLYTYFDEANATLRSEEILDEETIEADAEKDAVETESKLDNASKIAKDGEKVEGEIIEEVTDEEIAEESNKLIDQIEADTTDAEDMNANFAEYAKNNPLYAYLSPSYTQNDQGQYYPAQTARVGFAAIKDTARINSMLKMTKDLFPRDLKLVWSVKTKT